MSAHFVHQQKRDKHVSHHGSPLQLSSTTSQIRHVNRPHTSGLGAIATPLEMFFLFISILALLAVVIWLAWIAISHCITVVKTKVDDLDVGQQTKKNVKRAKEVPKKVLKIGLDVGRTTKAFLDGVLKSQSGEERSRRQGERRGLLRNEAYDERIPRGVPVEGYGYDRERYGDGTNDNSSHRSTSISVERKEDCGGPCGSSTRRRSVY